MKRRIIRPLPRTGIHVVPTGAYLSGDTLDYFDDGGDTPDDALYIAEQDDSGKETVRKDKMDKAKTHKRDLPGWKSPGKKKA